MRLLFAIKTLALSGGGAERVLAEISGALAARGHEIVVASFDAPEAPTFYRFDPAVRLLGLGIGEVGGGTRAGDAGHRMAALRRLAREMRPNVAVGFMHSAYLPLALALIGTGIPVVASEHTAYAHYRGRPLQRALLRFAPFLVRAITVLSSAVRAGYPPPLRRRMVVLPNPVSAGAKEPADVTGESVPLKTLLAVGRLGEEKDHKTLIAAFAKLAPEFPDWRLRIVGEGALRPRLEEQIRALGLGDRVSLPGASAKIGSEYAAAQLFAMPSTYESFGMTTAEALSHGLPVVGFADCPGTNELVRDGVNGLLAAGPDRVEALAGALATLIRSPELRRRMGSAGPASITDFAPGRIADKWEALLGGVASGPLTAESLSE